MLIDIQNIKIDWSRKGCNTCSKGAVHHYASSFCRGTKNPYKCLVAKYCKGFDQWTEYKGDKE